VDVSRLGYKMFRVYLKFFSLNTYEHNELVNLLVKNESVFWVSDTDSLYDLVFGIWVKDDKEFHIFYNKITQQFRKHIKEDRVTIVIKYSSLDKAYLLEKTPQLRMAYSIGGNEKSDFDDKDTIILKLLSKNARESIVNMANKVDMDSSAIIYRIKQLEKKGIITGYKLDIDLSILKRYSYSVKLYLYDFSKIKNLTSYLDSLPYATNLIEAIGGYDIEIDLEVESEEEYSNFVKDIRNRFDFISEILFFRTHKNYKILDMPELSNIKITRK